MRCVLFMSALYVALPNTLLARMRTPIQTAEAETFEERKRATGGLHFLSIQSGPEAEQPDGFWLLRDIEAANRARA